MTITKIENARLISQGKVLEATSLCIGEGKILCLGECDRVADQTIDLGGRYLSPGFIDIQLNGGYQRYFSFSPDAETLGEMTQASLEHATPFYYATLITSLPESIFAGIEAVRQRMAHDPHLLGMHLEGPFLSEKRRGAHRAEYIRRPDDALLNEIIERGQGVIRLITIAPESFSTEQIARLISSGIQVTIGHSDATYEEVEATADLGVRMITHLYNAMSPFTHRAPGVIGAALEDDRIYTPIILDGRHCHPAAARLAYKAKGHRLILTTDAAVLGRRLDYITWDGLDARLTEDGFYVNGDGNLAGSSISMPEAVRNACLFLGISLPEAADMASGRVADAIGLGRVLGSLTPGTPAAFSIFDECLDHYETLSFLDEGAN